MELPIGRKLTVEVVVRGVEDAVALPDTAGYPPVEDLATLVERAVEEAVEQLDLSIEAINSRDAAEFLAISHASFNKLAPSLPRCRISDNRFVYLRADLLSWLEAKKEAPTWWWRNRS